MTGLMSKLRTFPRSLLILASVVALYATVEFVVLDRFRLTGTVKSADGIAIEDAYVLVSVKGDQLSLPLPHSDRDESLCIGSFLVRSDAEGQYRLDRLSRNFAMVSKRAMITAYASASGAETTYSPIGSSLLLPSFSVADVQVPFARETSSRAADLHQSMFNSLARVFSLNRVCGPDALTLWRVVLDEMFRIAESEQQRRMALAYCLMLSDELAKADRAPSKMECREEAFAKTMK